MSGNTERFGQCINMQVRDVVGVAVVDIKACIAEDGGYTRRRDQAACWTCEILWV